MKLPAGMEQRYIVEPWRFALFPNYPNPFNPETWIPFELDEDSDVDVYIYDSRGLLIRQLELGYREVGSYASRDTAAYWDGRNSVGERTASGVYFYEVRTPSKSAVRRMVVVK